MTTGESCRPAVCFPFPLAGEGRGRHWHTTGLNSVDTPGPHPRPLPVGDLVDRDRRLQGRAVLARFAVSVSRYFAGFANNQTGVMAGLQHRF